LGNGTTGVAADVRRLHPVVVPVLKTVNLSALTIDLEDEAEEVRASFTSAATGEGGALELRPFLRQAGAND
jgi:hypothetical protein